MAREAWTDERLDDLNTKFDRLDGRMERGFEDMRAEFRAVRAEMKTESLAVRNEIGTQTRSFQHLVYGLIGTMLAGFIGAIATVVTQV